MILSWDANFNIKNEKEEINFTKNYLSNKIYFLIDTDENKDLTELTIEFTAILNSYYIIHYNLNRRGGQTSNNDEVLT